MEIPKKIQRAAQQLKKGRRVNRITVRDFLGHFGAERRGANKVEAIRSVLDFLDLETHPDFETVWIDEPIWLKLKDGVVRDVDTSPSSVESGDDSAEDDLEGEDREDITILNATRSAVAQASEQTEPALTSEEPSVSDFTADGESSDPTFRIGSLPAANKNPVVVNQDDTVAKAVTLMLQHDFSQLPVMQGEREIKGVITWKSICSRLALATRSERVGDYREDARIVDENRTLFDVIPLIVEYGYVMVRRNDRKIKGPVTLADLSLHLQALTEPFLLLREIELHVRGLIKGKVSSDDLASLTDARGTAGRPLDVADLTLGDYVRLLQQPQIWAKLQLHIDRSVLTALLDQIRVIRNDVMHFDPDPMTPDELGTLKRAVRLMQQLYEFFPLIK